MVRTGLRSVLEDKKVKVVGEAGTGAEALDQIPNLNVDVALLDIRLPDMDGIDLAKKLASVCPETRNVMLTSYSDESTVLRAARAGVAGYLLKEIAPDQLKESLQRVAAGHVIMDEKANDLLVKGLAHESKPDNEGVKWNLLSAQERKVTALVAEGLMNKEIADRLKLSEKTVKNYLASIFVKLDVGRRAQLAAWYIRHQSS